MSLYETLKAAKIGAVSDVLTTLRAQQAPFAKGGYTPTEKDLEGIPPLSFSANGENLIAYSIDGNMVQSGTPTSASPVYPLGCGELVESGEHSGNYTIPVVCGGSTTNIYLSEPVHKIGTYVDTVASSGTITRAIKKYTFTGTETIYNVAETVDQQNYCCIFRFWDTPFKDIIDYDEYMKEIPYPVFISSHFKEKQNHESAYNNILAGECGANTYSTESSDTSRNRYIIFCVAGLTTKEDYAAWFAQQYENETPVELYYILETPTTETVTAPTIPTVNGSNTFNVNTTLAPSNVYIKYKG